MLPTVLVRSELLTLTPDELRTELKYEPHDQDQLSDATALRRIRSAQGAVEDHLGRFIFSTQVRETWDLPCPTLKSLRLACCDVLEVQEVTAIDEDDVSTVLTAYRLVREHGACFLTPPVNSDWESAMYDAVQLTVTHLTGMFQTVAAVAPGLSNAIMVQSLWSHMNPELAGLGEHVKILLEPYERGEY